MSKKSKSKRFTQQSTDSVKKHDEQFPYREKFTDVERKQNEVDNHTRGGF